MSRGGWVAAGLGGVVVAAVLNRRTLGPLLPASLTDRVGDFTRQVRTGMAEREAQLRAELDLPTEAITLRSTAGELPDRSSSIPPQTKDD